MSRRDSSVVDNTLDYSTKPGVPCSIPCFFSLSDETLNQDPVSVWLNCWWDVKREFTHVLIDVSVDPDIYLTKKSY